MIVITYIISGLAKEKALLKLGGGLNQCYIHAPTMSFQEKQFFKKIYARLSDNNRTMLDTSCAGSFMMKTIELKWDLLEIIKRNSEDWDLVEGKESGMTPKFDCVKSFMIPMFSVSLALNMDLILR